MQALYESLDRRIRPEDIAQQILDMLEGTLSAEEVRVLQKASKQSLKHQVFSYTSMLQDFARPVGLRRQIVKAEELFTSAYVLTPDKYDDPEAVEIFVKHISSEIRKTYGVSDFKESRLNRDARVDAGLDISRRRYNKLFRLLVRMETRIQKLVREIRKYRFTKIGKSGLASLISWEQFSRDANTAAFIAYYTARCNLRSEFTISGQQRPYDEIAAMLFNRCQQRPNTNWWAIAHVFPEAHVLELLSESERGELLGQWFGVLQDVAGLLEEIWANSNFDRQTMIVHRGNDSSTWNNTASAWNKARGNWLALLQALGMEEISTQICVGKVMRLMAADVVAWHLSTGGKLDLNTIVWSDLPLPWEVLSGRASCPKSRVEAICFSHGVDPIKNGWTARTPPVTATAYRPTPELVHGVTVNNPFLATLLRKEGFFSGKHKSTTPQNQVQ